MSPRTRIAGLLLAALLAGVPAGAPPVATPRGAADDPSAPRPPEPPRVLLDTTMPLQTGRTLAVAAGGDLQAALDQARPGDTIVLDAGAVYRGPFTLPDKQGSGWIVVRSSAAGGTDFPAPGRRAGPAHAGLMPKLEARADAVILAAHGAHHYRLVGLEIRPSDGVFLFNLVVLGNAETSIDQLPHDIVLDRCYLHGDPRRGGRRGIALNSASTAVVDSYLSDFKEAGNDSQAIGGWNGPGPYAIVDNHLEAAGENVMFGGEATTLDQLVPSDIEIRANHFFKPPSWRSEAWTVKNLFELKNARRVRVEANLFENNWAAAQTGFAILLTARTVGDATPWAVVEDVSFSRNLVRNTTSAVSILGVDDGSPTRSGRTRNVAITNNLFLDVGEAGVSGTGTLLQILDGAAGVTFAHNTGLHTGSILVADQAPSPGLVFRDNIVEHNEYGVFGSGKGSGLAALQAYFPGYVFRRNVIVGTINPALYPPGNYFPPTIDRVAFARPADGDYRLSARSPYRRAATDGTDIGADALSLKRAGLLR